MNGSAADRSGWERSKGTIVDVRPSQKRISMMP